VPGKLAFMAPTTRTRSPRRTALACLACAILLVATAAPATTFAQERPVKIRLLAEGGAATATLENNPAARDFAALLPLSLTLDNYAVIERIATLPRKLTTPPESMGMTPVTGDIAYYAPWGNLAIYLNGTVADRGLVRLGKVDSGLSVLQRPGPFAVRIERMSD